MRGTWNPLVPGLVALLLMAATLPAIAQTRALRIEEGKVYVNEKLVPPGELPEALDAEAMDVNISFNGHERVVVQLNGAAYVLDGTGLHEASDADNITTSFSFYVSSGPAIVAPSGVRAMGDDEGVGFFAPENNMPLTIVMEEHMEELNARARSLQELSDAMGKQRVRDSYQWMQQVRTEAAEAARVAEALPRIEAQSYLQDVQQYDRSLYQQLLREQTLELESFRLAEQIRAMPGTPERRARIDELREKLSTIFDLKQMNRRHEIGQLENRLGELQNRLQAREKMRDRIIDLRLKELLEVQDPYNW